MVTLKSENGKYIVTVSGEKTTFETWNRAIKYIGECIKKEAARDE